MCNCSRNCCKFRSIELNSTLQISVTSTPKPSLRPFFASSRSLAPDAVLQSLVGRSAALGGAAGAAYSIAERHHSDESNGKKPAAQMTDSDSHAEVWTDQNSEHSDTPTTTVGPPTSVTSVSQSPPRNSAQQQQQQPLHQEDKTKVQKSPFLLISVLLI